MDKRRIAVLGAGTWGSALANVLGENQHAVTLWSHHQTQADELEHERTNTRYLPDFHLNEHVHATADLGQALRDANVVLFVVPTKAVRSVAEQVVDAQQVQPLFNTPLVVHAAKGLEPGTHLRISALLAEVWRETPHRGIVALSGPSHAEEVAQQKVTSITAAADDETDARAAQDLFSRPYFRLYTSTDLVGVELGGALKNVIALAAGAVDGLGLGVNAKAALLTRGLAEITRLGVKLGADPLTFSGLSGLGDLFVTANSSLSRNWRAGHALGEGQTPDELLQSFDQVVEGIPTTKVAAELATELGVEMPITQAMNRVLAGEATIKEAMQGLLARRLKPELYGMDTEKADN